MALPTRTVTGTLADLIGQAGLAGAYLTFTPSVKVLDSVGNVELLPVPKRVDVDSAGAWTVNLPINDAAGATQGFTYAVDVETGARGPAAERLVVARRNVAITSALVSPVKWSSLVPVESVVPPSTQDLATLRQDFTTYKDTTAPGTYGSVLTNAAAARPSTSLPVLWVTATAPTNKLTNDFWDDTTDDLRKRWNGTAWVATGSKAYVAIAARPVNALDAPYGLSTSNTAAQNRTAMGAALDAARTAGGGPVEVPRPGTFLFSKGAHPVYGAAYACLFAVPSGVTLKGAGIGATVFKLQNAETFTAGTTALIYNRVLDGGDDAVTLEDFTLDGNAANQTVLTNGITLIRTLRARHHRVRVKDVYGTSEGLPTETFFFDAQLGLDTTYQDCEAVGNTSGNTATGFASNGGTNIKWVNCNAHHMGKGHGWALFEVAGADLDNCWAYKNFWHGFNVEESHDVHFNNCNSGGQMADAAGDPYPHPALTSLGNGKSGFVINNTLRTLLANCTSRKNGDNGLTATATSSGRITSGVFADNLGHGLSMPDPRLWVVSGFPLVTGNTGAALSSALTSIPTAAGNWGDGPPSGVGFLPAPPMPASDVVYRNPFPFPVVVYLTGGTYTAVDLGVNIGAATQFHLAPNGSVAITYTVAPTWRWFATA